MTTSPVIQQKKQILFVDDDDKLLQGLKRGLRPMREVWDVHFASNADEGLVILRNGAIDIVIADVKMPKIDGFTFLKQVKQEFPHTLRVVLSGETGDEVGHKALEVANQCLAKPCGVEELKVIIEGMLSTQDRLGNGLLKDAMTQLDALPSIPQQYQDLKEAIDDPNSTMEGIAAVISKDMAMAAKVLQLANSAFFGFSAERITSLSRAITMLGLDLVGQLAMVTHVFSAYDKKTCPRFSIDDLWNHSMKVSYLARKIAMEEKGAKPIVEAALLGGLLHDIGKLVFATCVPADYNNFLTDLRKKGRVTVEEELAGESKVFGTTHPEVGAYMVGMWGLPDNIVGAVASHHNPEKCVSKQGMNSALAVAGAALLTEGRVESPLGRSLANALIMSNMKGSFERWKLLDDKTLQSN